MNNSPLVSIIIPNFNTEQYLGETIESVIAQSYSHWELLIVDDHSTDKSINIIQHYCLKNKQIKYFMTPKNSGGPATPRNIGIDNAQGEYIAFLDSDDTWFPEKLKFQIEYMARENCNFSSTMRNTFHLDSELKSVTTPNLKLKVYDYQRLLKKNLINTSAVVIHKDLTHNIHFNTTKKMIAVEDYDYWLKVLSKYKESILVFQFETINYRLTGENISGSKLKMARKFLQVLRKHREKASSLIYHFFTYSVLSLIYLLKKR